MKSLAITLDPLLPKLAWYARYDPSSLSCEVDVGRFVERDPSSFPQWVVAGLWSGDFAAGDFHRQEHMFGSGLRIDADGLHVVPASSCVDRCVYARDAAGWHLSNSLVVLLGRMGARLDPHADHARWSESPAAGVHTYTRQIPVVHPTVSTVNQLIFESMRLSPEGEQSFSFRDRPHTFAHYADYIHQLEAELGLLWANGNDERRTRRMRAVTTTSRGYDSPAVTALVTKIAPLVRSWSASHSNTRIPSLLRGLMPVDVLDDDGREIAGRLGADAHELKGNLEQLPAELEAWCWASSQTSPELAFHSLLSDAATHDLATVWFSGHSGDSVWGRKSSSATMNGNLSRSAQSGCSLIEARLWHGVIDCSVPCLFARSMRSISAITNSAEMAPWQLSNDYDRPIPRRLLEERGIPRSWFGYGKKAVVHDYESPVGHELRKTFFARSGWSETAESFYRGINFALFYSSRMLHFVRVNGDRAKLLQTAARNDKRTLSRIRDLHRDTFLMCVELLCVQFARSAAAVASAPTARAGGVVMAPMPVAPAPVVSPVPVQAASAVFTEETFRKTMVATK